MNYECPEKDALGQSRAVNHPKQDALLVEELQGIPAGREVRLERGVEAREVGDALGAALLLRGDEVVQELDQLQLVQTWVCVGGRGASGGGLSSQQPCRGPQLCSWCAAVHPPYPPT